MNEPALAKRNQLFTVRNVTTCHCCIYFSLQRNTAQASFTVLCLKRSTSCATTKSNTLKRFASSGICVSCALRFKLRNAHLRVKHNTF